MIATQSASAYTIKRPGLIIDVRDLPHSHEVHARWTDPGGIGLDAPGEWKGTLDLTDAGERLRLERDLNARMQRGDWGELLDKAAALVIPHSATVSVSRLVPKESNRENQDNRAFKLTPLHTFLAEPAETVSYVLETTLPTGGLSMLGARPKTGKTTWARNLALAVSRGQSVLGRATNPGSVLYLALEEKRGELQRQFQAMGATNEPILVHTGTAPDDATGELGRTVAYYKPALVVIDPLQDFARVRDMNDYSTVHARLAPIRDLARKSGTHILLLHHNNKADDLLGSTQLFGIVDTLLLMTRRDETRTIRSIQRYGEDLPETVLHLDRETGVISEVGDYQALQIDRAAEAVIEAMGGDELSEPDIRERVGGNERPTAKAIRHLVASGRLTRTGAGKRGAPYVYSVSRLDLIGSNRETESLQGILNVCRECPDAQGCEETNQCLWSG